MPHMEGIFINGEKAKFHPEDILDTDASQYTEEIGESVTAYLSEHITNPSNPPIDTSLSIAGAAADAKETGNELTQLKSELTVFGTTNDIPVIEGTKTTGSNVTFTGNNGVYSVSGSSSYNAYYSLFNESDAFPSGVKAGDTIIVGIDTNGSVKLDVSYYKDGALVTHTTIDENTYIKYTIYQGATGLNIRFRFPANSTYDNVTARPYMLTAMSKQEIALDLADINTNVNNNSANIAKIKNDMPTAGTRQFFNPEAITVINARVSSAGKLIADNNYRSLIIPASVKANSEYRAKYLGENPSNLVEFRFYTFDDASVGNNYVDAPNLYDATSCRIQTTTTAQYFLLHIYPATMIDDVINNTVIAESTEYPTEYTPYYISVDDAINFSIGKYTSPDCIEVGTNSDKYEYTDINSAVVANPNSIIHVNYGTYETEVGNLATDKKLIGKDRDLCVLTGTNKDYDTPPIEIAGGIVKNFTVSMVNDPEAEHTGYCLHSDSTATANKTLLVENCKFTCTGQHSVGLGVRGGETVIFKNCEFEQNDGVSARTSIYMHNSSGTATATMRFRNCYFKGYDYCMKLQAWASECPVQFEFIDCTCISEVYGTTDDCVWTDHASGDTHDTTKMHSFSGKFALLPTSHGNNIAVLNA